ncbi:MAG: hypothetical protein JW925_06015 [Syntrophaceae bacterium]|nr:hypothetical protein [Syntrophaceae bacterium]
MGKNKRILFIVNGLGMGNSTRCHAIIENLHHRGYAIDVITSGNGMDYFRHHISSISDLIEFKSLFYTKFKGKLSIGGTILSIPVLAFLYIQNICVLYKTFKNKSYDAVVIDSDYTILLLRIIFNIPVFAINNADVVVREMKKLDKIPRKILMQFMVEKMDYWFHRVFVDFVLSPTILEWNSHSHANIHHFPPFIRSGLTVTTGTKKVHNILIMLSGSQFSTDVRFIENKPYFPNMTINVMGRNGSSTRELQYLGKLYDNKSYLNMADILIINAGFSAVSEAVLLRKPCVIIPIDHHAEQHVNARIMEQEGYALVANIDNVWQKTTELITNYHQVQQALDRKALPLNGHWLAADMIDEKINSMQEKSK